MLPVVLISVLAGNELLGPVQVFPAHPGVVKVDEGAVAVASSPSAVFVAWTDSRRTDALSSSPADPLTSDLWLKTIGTRAAELVCIQKSPASRPSLGWYGQLALAWRHGAQAERLSLALSDGDGGWNAAGPCGVVLSADAGASGPAVVARPSMNSALVLWETAPGVIGGVDVAQSPLGRSFPGTDPAGVESSGALFVGALVDGGLETWRDGASDLSRAGSAFAFAPDPTVAPPLFVVTPDFQLVEARSNVSAPTVSARGKVSAAMAGNSPVALVGTAMGVPVLWSPQQAPRVAGTGTPVGLASSPQGNGVLALLRISGELVGVPFDRTFTASGPVPISVTHGLQRRPSLGWANGRWVIAFEELDARTWAGSVGLIDFAPFSENGLTLPPLVWPRLLPHPGGGVVVLYRTPVAERVAAFVATNTLDLSLDLLSEPDVESGAPGETSSLFWKAPVNGRHDELIARSGAMPVHQTFDGEVRCGTWVQGRFWVTRRKGGAMFLADFDDTQLPGDLGNLITGTDACVAGRPLVNPTEVGLAAIEGQSIVVSEVSSSSTWRVPTGPAPHDVRLAPIPGGWVVHWEDLDGLEVAFVDEDGARRYRLDDNGPRFRGRAALAVNPEGQVVVAWAGLEGDGVVLRARRFVPVRSPDGGVPNDAGVPDDAGVPEADGGVDARDAGAADGGSARTFTFVPRCSCSSLGGPVVLLALLGAGLSRRKRRAAHDILRTELAADRKRAD